MNPRGGLCSKSEKNLGLLVEFFKTKKRLADKIIRDNLKNQIAGCAPPIMPQPFTPMGGLLSALPTPPMAMFNSNMHPGVHTFQTGQPQQSYGPCFNCNQMGHLARNCPMPQRSTRRSARPSNKKFGPKTFGKKK